MPLKSDSWRQSLSAHCAKLQIASSNTRNRLACGLFYISNIHHFSIVDLAMKGLPGSAFALLRPQFEAYVRGLWCQYIANDDALNNFDSGGKPPPIDRQIQNIEELEEFNDGMLSAHRKLIWVDMCDFTHAGGKLAALHMSENFIGASFTSQQIKILYQTADAVALFNSVAFSRLCENPLGIKRICASHRRIFKIKQ